MCVSFHGCSDSPAPSEDASAGDGGAYRLSIVEDKVVLASGSGRLGFYLTDEEGSFKGSEEDITVSLSVSPAPVSSYNSMYRADARLLPEGTYSLGECVLTAGETEGEIGFDIDWDALPVSTQTWVLPLSLTVTSGLIKSDDTAWVMVPGICRDPLTGQIRMYLSSEGAYVDVFYTEGNDKCIIYYPGGGFSNLTQNNDIAPDCLANGVSIGMVTYRLPDGDRTRTVQDCEEALFAMASAGGRFGESDVEPDTSVFYRSACRLWKSTCLCGIFP